MKFSQLLFVSCILLVATTHALLQCGNNYCGGTDACCNDAYLGYVCYNPSTYQCEDNAVGALKLCDNADKACNVTCYDPSAYFCCNGQIEQIGQSCATATVKPTTVAPTVPANNCPGAANSAGVNCPAGTTCCGAGTITPSCINNTDTSVTCCTYFLSSTQCPAGSTCGGELGPGASSDALCGPAGSTFCNAGFNLNSFCTAGEVCCTSTGNGFCCPAGNTCGTSYGSCIAPATAAPTARAATTKAPTTKAPTTPAPAYNCPNAGSGGINCPVGTTCCGAQTITPSCINNTDTSVSCCTYFLSSTQCPAGSTCGGSLGPGASSDAQCGPAGSTFCNAGFNENAFCTASQKCCTSYGTGFCCPSGQTCGTQPYQCVA